MNNYICKYCNKQCRTGQSLGAHIVNCKSNPKYFEINKKRIQSKTQDKLKYTFICKKCGKSYMIQISEFQYNSGNYRKYCSRTCANSRTWTEQDKLKKSISSKNSIKVKIAQLNHIKFETIIICPVCKTQFRTRSSKQRFCSKQCVNQGQRLGLFTITKPLGGYRAKGGRGKQGWYKGIYCNSSWELAYVMYCLDNNINIKRNTKGYEYLFKDSIVMNYYPDFLIGNNDFVEIKGFKDQRWEYKLKYFPYKLTVIDGNSIQPYLNYAKQIYGANFVQLYE